MDVREARELAKRETASEELEKLAKSSDYQTRKAVAANPNTPVKVLEMLGKEFPEEIVNNPIFDLLWLENPDGKFVKISLARSSTTKPETLARLAKSDDGNLLCAIAENPNTSWDTLLEVFQIDVGLTSHPNTLPPSELNELVSGAPSVYERALASHQNATPEFLEILVKASDPEVVVAVTQNLNTPTHILEALAVVKKSIIREPLLKNPNITDSVREVIKLVDGEKQASVATLSKLATNPYLHIRRIVADNIDTPTEALQQLAQEDDSTILESITIHPNVSLDTLKSIATRLLEYARNNKKIGGKGRIDPRKFVLSKCYRYLIEDRRVDLSIKKQLVSFIDSLNYTGVLSQLARSKAVEPEILLQVTESRAIFCDNILRFWLFLAENPHTPEEALASIYQELEGNGQYYTDTRQIARLNKALSKHPNAPAKIKQQIAPNNHNSELDSEISLAADPLTPPEVLRELAKSSDSLVCRYVINNHSTPVDVFEYYLEHHKRNIPSILRSRNIPIAILKKLLDKNSVYYKKELASNPNIPASILEKLATETSYKILENLAENPSTPTSAIDLLSQHPRPKVRYRAIKHQNISQAAIARIIKKGTEFVRYIQLTLLEKILQEYSGFSEKVCLKAISLYCSFETIEKLVKNDNIAGFYLDYLAFNLPGKSYFGEEDSLQNKILLDRFNLCIATLKELADTSDLSNRDLANKIIEDTFKLIDNIVEKKIEAQMYIECLTYNIGGSLTEEIRDTSLTMSQHYILNDFPEFIGNLDKLTTITNQEHKAKSQKALDCALAIKEQVLQNKQDAAHYLYYLVCHLAEPKEIDRDRYLLTIQRLVAANSNASIATLEKLTISTDVETAEKAKTNLKAQISVSALRAR